MSWSFNMIASCNQFYCLFSIVTTFCIPFQFEHNDEACNPQLWAFGTWKFHGHWHQSSHRSVSSAMWPLGDQETVNMTLDNVTRNFQVKCTNRGWACQGVSTKVEVTGTNAPKRRRDARMKAVRTWQPRKQWQCMSMPVQNKRSLVKIANCSFQGIA